MSAALLFLVSIALLGSAAILHEASARSHKPRLYPVVQGALIVLGGACLGSSLVLTLQRVLECTR